MYASYMRGHPIKNSFDLILSEVTHFRLRCNSRVQLFAETGLFFEAGGL